MERLKQYQYEAHHNLNSFRAKQLQQQAFFCIKIKDPTNQLVVDPSPTLNIENLLNTAQISQKWRKK